MRPARNRRDRCGAFLSRRLMPHGEPAKRVRAMRGPIMDGRSSEFLEPRVERLPVLPQTLNPAHAALIIKPAAPENQPDRFDPFDQV